MPLTETAPALKAPSKPVPSKLKTTTKIPSLKALANQAEVVVKEDETVVTKENVYQNLSRNEVFGLQDLKTCWQSFAEKKKNEGKAQEYILLNEDLSLLEGNVIELKLTNPVQEETLNNIKPELTTFLRESLSNDFITITSVINKEPSKRRLYTTREKFDHLATKHPLLLELKERLGLDPDF